MKLSPPHLSNVRLVECGGGSASPNAAAAATPQSNGKAAPEGKSEVLLASSSHTADPKKFAAACDVCSPECSSCQQMVFTFNRNRLSFRLCWWWSLSWEGSWMCVSVDSFWLSTGHTLPRLVLPQTKIHGQRQLRSCVPILESHIIGVAAAACARTHISSFSTHIQGYVAGKKLRRAHPPCQSQQDSFLIRASLCCNRNRT